MGIQRIPEPFILTGCSRINLPFLKTPISGDPRVEIQSNPGLNALQDWSKNIHYPNSRNPDLHPGN